MFDMIDLYEWSCRRASCPITSWEARSLARWLLAKVGPDLRSEYVDCEREGCISPAREAGRYRFPGKCTCSNESLARAHEAKAIHYQKKADQSEARAAARAKKSDQK